MAWLRFFGGHLKSISFSTIIIFTLLASCSRQLTATPTSTTEGIRTAILRVAYSKNADPWIWIENEGSRQLVDATNIMNVAISSDGQVVAFQREDTSELSAISADGEDLRSLAGQEFLARENSLVWNFDFAPGSHNVFFTTRVNEAGFLPRYDLYVVDADAAEPTPILVFGPGHGGIATFSPDGQWMSLYHAGALELARVNGNEARTIFSYPEGYEPATFGPDITWMEDSCGFSAFHVPDPVYALDQGGLWFVPVNGEPIEKVAVNSSWGIPSPDGQRVGYSTQGDEAGIHIVIADGTDATYMAAPGTTFGGWTPDSQHFMIILDTETGDSFGTARRVLLGELGEEPSNLTDTNTADRVRWITDEEFLFTSGAELRLQRIGEASILLDDQVYNIFDYSLINP